MGLDTVELVMEVEQQFGITIDDRDAEKIVTVGMLHRYILARLGRSDVRIGPPPCPGAFAFHRVRQALMDGPGIDRASIRPDAAMDDLVARPSRREAWDGLARTLGWRLPPLVRPSWMVEALFVVVSLGVSAGIVAGLRLGADAASVGLWIGLGLPSLAVAAAILTRPFATRFPAVAADLRNLIRSALDLNRWAIRRQAGLPVADGDVWDALTAIVSEQAGVPPDMLKEDTSFVGDLGLG